MVQNVPAELLDYIHRGRKFLIAGHKEPDGDCIGSQIVLASLVRRLGKEAVLCSAGPFKRSETKSFEHFFVSAPGEGDRAGACVILVDCSAPDRTGSLEPFLKNLPMALIDHHDTAGGDPAASGLSSCRVMYKDPRASSTTLLILKLAKALGLELNKEEAEFLFLGLCTDTGFFRHVDNTGAETFEAAAELIRSGANPKSAFASMYGGKPLNSRLFLGHILTRAESFFNGKLIYSYEGYDDICRFGLESRDSDSLYQLLQSIAGVEAILVIRQETPESCSIGLRSRDAVDVGNVAALFGGGGHKNAAGINMQGTIAELKPKLLKAFADIFKL